MQLDRESRIYVAGHRGMVGSAICRELDRRGCSRILTRTHDELDLRDKQTTHAFLEAEKPDFIFVAAARVGGIKANRERPVDFLHDNLQIQNNLIHGAHLAGVRKLLFLGSSCIYPRLAPQPIPESALLTGPLEPTNQWYALAKICGIKLCEAFRQQHGRDFISAMPTNLYGPNDNYDLESSHVLPALIRRFHEGRLRNEKTVTCWGTGQPLREFLHADDLARACVFLMENYSGAELVNVGFGREISILDLAELVKEIVGFNGEIRWDTSQPDGTPRKLMDSQRLFAMGWRPEIDLRTGIRNAYDDFLKNVAPKLYEGA